MLRRARGLTARQIKCRTLPQSCPPRRPLYPYPRHRWPCHRTMPHHCPIIYRHPLRHNRRATCHRETHATGPKATQRKRHPAKLVIALSSQENGTGESILTGRTHPLANIEVSAAYYPRRYVGVRPHIAILVPLDDVFAGLLGSGPTYSMSSRSLGLSLDLALDRGRMARYFVSPGLAYHFASFSAVVPQYRTGSITETWNADGLGYEIAFGSELSFGMQRTKGISILLVLQRAKLSVSGRPASPPVGAPQINTLDFSSVLLQVGYQIAPSDSGSGS